MRIQVVKNGFDGLDIHLFHLCKLFFEEPELTEAGSGLEAALQLSIKISETAGGVRGVIALRECSSGAVFETSHVKQTEADKEAWKLAVRRVISYGVLQVLQEYTGLEQAWGTLTGVRPTKLMHNLLREHGKEASILILQDEYLVSEGKALLLADIAERQLKVIPDLFDLDKEISVYIGIPFCPTKCAYCTFPAYDIRGNNGSVEAFLVGLHEEIRETGRWLKEKHLRVTTLYWGGGTPTSITAEQMDALFQTLHSSFPSMDQIRELTVEAGRPDTITEDKINVMKRWKVDRISINPQSFTQETLDAIGRHHTVKETVDKFQLAREMGLNNINMDLIIGLPNEGVKELTHSLEQTERFMPESLTVHTLSFKRASKMTKNKEQYEVAERDEITTMIEMTSAWTLEHGYVPYYLYRQKNILGNQENIGYSLPGFESLYNILMMEERQTVIGLGCGAVSKIVYPQSSLQDDEEQRIERFPNPKEPAAYNEAYKQYIDKKLQLLNDAYRG